MIKTELIRRSPLRILEKSIHGGVGKGCVGVIASRKGTGKTACLVHIATDQLLQDKHVIHVSFSSRTDHIVTWYEDIFREIAKKRNLEDAMSVHDTIVRHRVVMNFNQDGITADQLLRSIKAMVEDGQFAADVIIVDGYDFERGKPETVIAVKNLAEELGVTVWFSASVHRDDPSTDKNGVPALLCPYIESISVLITLQPTSKYIKLSLVKDHDSYTSEDLHLMLDPATLLIAEDG
jgi:KaiC/GvpD/RAD55 family RecA-like ATPase